MCQCKQVGQLADEGVGLVLWAALEQAVWAAAVVVCLVECRVAEGD